MDPTLLSVLVSAAAASFFLALLFAAFFLVCRYQKPLPHRPPDLSSLSALDTASFDLALKPISVEDLRAATRNFSADLIVGDGGFGLVYKASLHGGVAVAIKRLDPDAFQGFREFRAEMETLGTLQHRNIVRILGYCASGSDRMLIYEFAEKGSLDQWLHDTWRDGDSSVKLPLSWETRVKVVRGVADGLDYLHGLDTPIIHRDIKASNILLDSDFEAHIADFGLARCINGSVSHVWTQVAGTMGYMPPEYKEGVTVATVKADVYSFGVLMFEIMTGKRPNLPLKVDGKEIRLIEWSRKMLEQNRHMEMLDPRMPKEGTSEDSVKEYFRIASMSSNDIGMERPVMSEVVEMLKGFAM